MAASDDPLIGETVRGYEILERLGEGGGGIVYRARHQTLDYERALKFIRADALAKDASLVRRFIREAKVLAKLTSPYAVRIFDCFPADAVDPRPCIVMELLLGEPVSRCLEQGRLPVARAVRIAREAALALSEAHGWGVVHRDVSPDNLYLVKGEDGREVTKVIDFGIAKPMTDEGDGLTRTDLWVGNRAYASPEMCGGETIDGRSDIYSLGVTLYHMLAGRHPFQVTTEAQYIGSHLKEVPEPPSKHVPTGVVPRDLERIVMTALQKDPGKRQQTMAELVRELEPWLARELQVGEVFAGRYRIDGTLGKGGMGAVYRAADRLLGTPVAVKVVLGGGLEARERLRREALVAKRVTHPNVCRVHDLGEHDGMLYVTMEVVTGETLDRRLRAQHRLEAAAALELLGGIVAGVAAAHAEGLVHRDLKPGNVMVDASGRACVMDFGLALSPELTRLTETGTVVGTPHYMAPEQALGNPMDGRTDVYALGAILYHMLTGRPPFDGKNAFEILRAHIDKPPVEPSRLVSEIPRPLEAIVLRCLAKKPEDRYPTALALRAAVEQAARSPKPGVAAGPDTLVLTPFPAVPTSGPEATPAPDVAAGARAAPAIVGAAEWTFDVVTVAHRGTVKDRRKGRASGFVEDLGNGVVLEMVHVPGGRFAMGSPKEEDGRFADEDDQHDVTVPSFWMGRFPITQAQWRAAAALPQVGGALKPDPSRFKGPDRPVENVSWTDAAELCARLSRRLGKTYRLPSGAEWEYACRADTKTPFHFGPTITPELVNYDGNHPYGKAPKGTNRKETVEVGSLGAANGFGLFDMHGNVWEWCQDRWHTNYDRAPRNGEAWEEGQTEFRVVRGGSWRDIARSARAASRSNRHRAYWDDYVGVRVVMTARTP